MRFFTIWGAVWLGALIGQIIGAGILIATALLDKTDYVCRGVLFPNACVWLNHHATECLTAMAIVVGLILCLREERTRR